MDDIVHIIKTDSSAEGEYRYKKFTTRLLIRDLRFQKGTAKAGDHLPSSRLFTANGMQTTIKDLASGKPVLLIFGSLTCPMTASAMPALNELYQEFGKRVEFVIVQVSRYLVKDFGTSKSPKSTRKRDAYCAPAALRPCRFATPSQARRWLRTTPSNGWTAC